MFIYFCDIVNLLMSRKEVSLTSDVSKKVSSMLKWTLLCRCLSESHLGTSWLKL